MFLDSNIKKSIKIRRNPDFLKESAKYSIFELQTRRNITDCFIYFRTKEKFKVFLSEDKKFSRQDSNKFLS